MNTINPNAELQLASVRLSGKADAQLVDDKDGVNGKLNLTSDGRKYYIAIFRDPSNPFGAERTRVIAQTTDSEDNPVWKAGNPSLIKQFVGKNILATSLLNLLFLIQLTGVKLCLILQLCLKERLSLLYLRRKAMH